MCDLPGGPSKIHLHLRDLSDLKAHLAKALRPQPAMYRSWVDGSQCCLSEESEKPCPQVKHSLRVEIIPHAYSASIY